MRRDPRTAGHPTLGPKYEAEGRSRPHDPFESPRAIPLHYQTHDDQRVLLGPDGAPALHHEAWELLTRGAAAARERAAERAAEQAAGPLVRVRHWLSPPEVARLLEVEPRTIRDWIERGEIPAARPGGQGTTYHIDIKALDAVLSARGYTQDQLREFRATWEAWTGQAEE